MEKERTNQMMMTGFLVVVEVTQLIKKRPALKNINVCCNNYGIRRSFVW